MELSTVQTNDFLTEINYGDTFQEIAPHSSEKCPVSSERLTLLKNRKTLEDDALLAVKLDPAVLEAQVTVTEEGKNTPAQGSSALAAKLETKDVRCYPSYEEVASMHQAALLGLTPQQLILLMVFMDMLRRQRQRQNSPRQMYCAFCKNNGSPASWYSSHTLRDRRRRTRCPVLRALRCPRCGATGDHAHTPRHCPENIFSDSWSCP